MKRLFLLLFTLSVSVAISAQRYTDRLSRGLVATKASSGVFVSWRMLGEEYYDVTYNLYCNGSRIASNLTKTNYSHTAGSTSSSYQVAAVVRGVEQEKCAAVKPWASNCLTIPTQKITGRDGTDVTGNYTLNDVSLGDVDGDGISEFIVKRPCSQAANVSQKNCFHVLDCYDHKGNRLWWIDLGPNMLSGADEQWDAVMFDWDEDGKAEVLMRIQDNAIIHYSDGSKLEIVDMTVDTRWDGIEYTSSGNEYLLYLEGATGKPYQIGPSSHPNYMDYPNPRGQDSDWGSGIVGHRSTKHYFGAPYLDGRHASIFLGRGCYTKHMMKAFDVDPVTHALTLRWSWDCNVSGPWFGQGYHNFAVGDVDWDGRDEIIFGSMIIDDNGMGLSTTGLGHGDAQHCSDLDPFRKYEEQFACNESSPANNYRNAVTSEFYYRQTGSGDDGRALMANFTNDYPGSVGRSVGSGWISSCADKVISELNGDAFISWGDLNQRVYWDGDLLDEYFDSPGTEGYGVVYKPASQTTSGGRWNFTDSKCSNWSKNNPGAIGDILGDWREEVVMRNGSNNAILVYTTQEPTEYGIPTLWSDHQYRNAMVWQSMGYNQPPHKSYFLGELEGITQAPPTNTMIGRTEVANGGTITSADEHLLVCETNDTKVTIQDGASPYMVTFNVPSWVQGSAASNTTAKSPKISYDYFTCTVEGGALTGATRVVKQGDGILTFPAVDMTYTGETNIWNGTFNINGSLTNSPVWLNRFAGLNTPAKAITLKSLKADYGSEITIGGKGAIGELTSTESITLGMGSRISFDIYSDGFKADKLNTAKLVVEKKDWKYGPKYLIPVFEFIPHPAAGEENIAPGTYCLGKIGAVTGNLSDIKIEGISKLKASLSINANEELVLTLSGVRDASEIKWNGNVSSVWDYANTENFLSYDQTQTPEIFVEGDKVHFTDEASVFKVNIQDGAEMRVDTVFFDNKTKNYTLGGNGIITKGNFVKSGEGSVTISGDHTYTGEVHLRGGLTSVSSLANSTQAYGNLGGVKSGVSSFTIEDGAVLNVTSAVKNGSLIRIFAEGVITNTSTFTQEKAITGDTLIKRGGGYFDMQGNLMAKCLRVEGGTFSMGNSYTNKVILGGGGALSGSAFVSSPLEIKSGAKATLNTANRVTYTNTLSGNGQITVYGCTEKGSGWYATRTPLQLNMKSFGGTLVAQAVYAEDGRFTLDTANGSDSLTLDVPSGIIVQNRAKTLRIGKLIGNGSLGGYCTFSNDGSTGTNTWQVGNDEDFTFNGGVVASDRFVKKGRGVMTVGATSMWTTSGAVTIEEGEIKILTNAASSKLGSLGTGVLTVAAGAKLSGFTANSASNAEKIPMTNSSYIINGTINPNNLSTIFGNSYANMGGKDVTINSGGKLEVMAGIVSRTARAAACLTNVKKMTMNDGAILSLTFSSTYNPATYVTSEDKSESFTVFQATSSSIGNIILNLPDLLPYSKNLYYDYSDINNGVITIRYREIAIKGDVNGDGIVNGTDIQAIINFIVGGQYDEKADVNEDGVVNGTDIQEIINIIVSTE